MKKILPYIVPIALFFLVVYVYTYLERKHERELLNASAVIETLKIENNHLQKLSDSLFDRSVVLDAEMAELEKKADSLGEVATLPMPCEHELELRKEEVRLVRGALAKCKESKAIQTTRVGIAEIRVENQVAICDNLIKYHKTDLKAEKRRSFLRGAGTGGLIVGILIILAL